MGKKSPTGPERPVTPEVQKYLSANGKKGGATTRRLIELGKNSARQRGENVSEEVMEELHRSRKGRAA